MADIEFSCPGCGMVLSAPEEMAGELVECPECSHQMNVPMAGEAGDEDGAQVCPECGQAMSDGAVLCLGCGFHTKLGKKISTEFQ